MNKVIYIFTKTNWSEPPRIRHQVTNMLIKRGYEVYFFQKPTIRIKNLKERKENLVLLSTFELIHHQLRFISPLIWLNKLLVKWNIKNISKDEPKPDVIINFNYDYYFLKELYPNVKIVNIINDDFIEMAKPWMKKLAKEQLHKTCLNGDETLTVSYPLEKQLLKFTDNVHLFFPWAGQRYQNHGAEKVKDTVLWWGYIRHNIDWDTIEYLLKKGVKIRMVGPIMKAKNIDQYIEQLQKYDNFELQASTSLDKLNFDDICCSLLSYRKDVEIKKGITISNRGFNLLSNGIPLVYVNLPELIEAPVQVITKCDSKEDYLNAVKYFQNNWNEAQPYIKDFLEGHYEEDRYEKLKSFIN
ncbi:hypothetical protein FJR48_03830 [Sulfurimonas lithotrophica]|uniref:Glycosyltransferase n=1 Tax=Sulfurimonas lithotrophica TaxID=2590022 RepID=A0A5P8NZL8_9BACT|nr:hypothetical protein [Sulfurimonas lithotrophica]QFR48896.1 hypothetical protein FJR48_03830 [Sulfurimonas lithotrophica]